MCESAQESSAGVRVVLLHLPEDEGEGLGFKLTRTLWDPYPWVREVSGGGRAEAAGLRSGDCVLQADGRDLLGMPVGQVAGLIRGDGGGRGVSLLVWSCGTSPQDDPELLWSAGGGARGERSRRALGGVLRALACVVCSASAAAAGTPRAAQCTRGHLYCAGCRARLQRCALCRETLPALDTPQARNLVAEQVFEAIAAVYELKEPSRAPNATASASSSPHRSPLLTAKTPHVSVSQRNSPSPLRKTVQFGLNAPLHHGSDISLNRPLPSMPEWSFKRVVPSRAASPGLNMASQTESEAGLTRVGSETNSCKSNLHACCEQNDRSCHQSVDCGCPISPASGHNSTATKSVQSQSDNCHETAQAQNRCRNVAENQSSCHKAAAQQTPCNENSYTRNCCRNPPQARHACQNPSESCQHPSDTCQHPSDTCQHPSDSCQNPSDSCQNSPAHCQVPAECCHSPRQLFLSQQGLNLVPVGRACGLQHRLVARLRPACSLADLACSQAHGLSKSWSDEHVAEGVPAEKSGSMDNLRPTNTPPQLDELYVMSPQPPLYVWAYQH